MRVAGIQAASVFLDSARTLDKALSLMREAASSGAELCVFPETFLSGYPFWVDITDGARWNDADQKKAYAAYVSSSISHDGPEITALCETSRELDLFVYMGLVERAASQGSVYCSLAAIDPAKGLVSLHRKLMPTHQERMVWSPGDGNGLVVHEYRGIRVGGLNCWENWMPLARYSLYQQGEHLHVATWPGAPFLTQDITRFIALEGRVYSLAVGGVLTLNDIPDAFPLKDAVAAVRDRYLSGGSMLVGPDGTVLQEAAPGEETILYCEIDVDKVIEERQNFDPAGHYARPDVFQLEVDRSRRTSPK